MTDQNKQPAAYDQQVGFIRGMINQAQLVMRLLGDRRVPVWLKLLPAGTLVYLISPIDAVPGALIPVLGQADDVAAVLIGLKLFIDLAPPHVVQEHMAAIMGESDADWDAGDSDPTPNGSGTTTADADDVIDGDWEYDSGEAQLPPGR